MDDLISRQAAIKWCRPEDWGTPDERWRPESEYGAMLKALPSAQQWIPCSERLPEQYGNYLVSIDGEEIDIGTINPDAKYKGWSLCNANGFYWADEKGVKVIAWMPLPEPYKEKQEGENK